MAGAAGSRQQEALSWLTAGQLAASVINFTAPNLLTGKATHAHPPFVVDKIVLSVVHGT
jgi:hypothetical protein